MFPDDDNEAQDDLRSVIERAFAETEAPEEQKAVPEAKESVQPRGEDGKFVGKEAADGEAETASAEVVSEEEAEASETKETAEKPLDFPQHFTQADKDLVNGLPKEHQTSVLERLNARFNEMQSGFTPKLQRAAEIEKQWAPTAELFAPHMEALRSRGQTPSDIIKAWAQVEQDLMDGQLAAQAGRPNEKGAALVARLIQNYSVDPGLVAQILTDGMAGKPPPINGGIRTEVPPEVMREITALKAKVESREQFEQEQRTAALQTQVDAFVAEKNPDGTAKYPFFSDVRHAMALQAQIEESQGRTPSLPDLYDSAVYANRETRQKLLQAQKAEQERKAASDRKAKAEAAKRASSSVTGSPGTGQSQELTPTKPRSLREEIEAALADQEAA